MSEPDPVAFKIARLLERKREIDSLSKDRFVETQRWLCEAVELLASDRLGSPHDRCAVLEAAALDAAKRGPE